MKKLLLLVGLIFLFGGVGQATNLYTSSTGSDTANNCQTLGSPCDLTNGFANEMAAVTAANGDILYMCSGACNGAGSYTWVGYWDTNVVYDPTTGWDIPDGTSFTNALTITPYPGETITWQPTGAHYGLAVETDAKYVIFKSTSAAVKNFIFDGINATSSAGCIRLSQSDYIRLQYLEIKNCPSNGILTSSAAGPGGHNEIVGNLIHDVNRLFTFGQPYHGIYNAGMTDNIIDGNTVYNIHRAVGQGSSYGIQVYDESPSQAPDRTIVRNNLVHDTDNGIALGYGANIVAYNNVTYAITVNYPIQIGFGQSGAKVYNNTLTGGTDVAILSSGSADIQNNIFYNNTFNRVSVVSGSPTYATNACPSAGTGCSVLMGSTNPFTDSAGYDFSLTETSPALETGTDLGVSYNTDIEGRIRPQGLLWDIGAYERTPIVGTGTCSDGIQNGDETGVDSGGRCGVGGGGTSGNVRTEKTAEPCTGMAAALGGSWVQTHPTVTVNKDGSGACTASASSTTNPVAYDDSQTYGDSQYSEQVINTLGTATDGSSGMGVATNVSSGTGALRDGAIFGAYTVGTTVYTDLEIYVNGSNVATYAAANDLVWPTHRIALEWVAGHYWGFYDDEVVLDIVDATLSGGKPGIGYYGDATGDTGKLGTLNETPGVCTDITIQTPAISGIFQQPTAISIGWTPDQFCSGSATFQSSSDGVTARGPSTTISGTSPYSWSGLVGSGSNYIRVCYGAVCSSWQGPFTINSQYAVIK